MADFLKEEYVVTLAGLIGSGKSTNAKHLFAHIPNTSLYEEKPGENPHLSKYYELIDPKRVSPAAIEEIQEVREKTQEFFQLDKLEMLKEASMDGGLSIFDADFTQDIAYLVFNYSRGQLNQNQFERLLNSANEILEEINVSAPDMVIFVSVTIENALQRIEERSREGESSGVTAEFLRELQKILMLFYGEYGTLFEQEKAIRSHLEVKDKEVSDESISFLMNIISRTLIKETEDGRKRNVVVYYETDEVDLRPEDLGGNCDHIEEFVRWVMNQLTHKKS